MFARLRLLLLAVLCALGLFVALHTATRTLASDQLAAPAGQPASPANALTRQRDPVVVTGAALPAFAGAPLDQLFVYAYAAGTWTQIPFQFDEVEPAGNTYVPTEDGALDANDELAFMARDAGQQAPAGAWIADAESTAYPRVELRVVDPLHPAEQAWVYVFRSPTLAPSFGPRYLQVTADSLATPFYSATINFSETLGLAGLALNAHPQDIVDRSHVSVKGRILNIIPVQLCEQDIASLITGTGSVLPPQDAPVRYVTGVAAQANGQGVYPASLRSVLGPIDLDALAAAVPIQGLTLQELRTSLDLLNPAASGYAPARYFASTTAAAGVPIDGAPDSVPATLAAWSQVNGSYGSVVQLNQVQTFGTTAYGYYLDNAGATAADCHGSDGAYGENGVRIAPFTGLVTVTQQLYFAEPLNQAAGALYQSYAANPLQTANAQQITCYYADLQPDATHADPALCDDDVDVADVERVAVCWNQPPGSAACPAALDVDRNGSISASDITAVAGHWGWSR